MTITPINVSTNVHGIISVLEETIDITSGTRISQALIDHADETVARLGIQHEAFRLQRAHLFAAKNRENISLELYLLYGGTWLSVRETRGSTKHAVVRHYATNELVHILEFLGLHGIAGEKFVRDVLEFVCEDAKSFPENWDAFVHEALEYFDENMR